MQKKSNNAQLVGQKLNKATMAELECTTDEHLDFIKDDHVAYLMNSAKQFILLRHFGYWLDHDAQRILSFLSERIATYWRKPPRSIQFWDQEVADSLFTFLILNDAEAVFHVCKWATPKRTPSINHRRPRDMQRLYLMLCSNFRRKPVSIDKLGLESKSKEVGVYCDLVSSVGSKDQEGFEKGILDCLQLFKRKPKPGEDHTFMQDWLPFDLNVFYLAGLQLGLADPKFPSDVMAYLATAKSAKVEIGNQRSQLGET